MDFTHNVTVSYQALVGGVGGPPYLLLETGVTNRKAYYVSHGGNTVNFLYEVKAGDATADLDYVSTDSLVVPANAWIRRDSTTPTTDVVVTLPTPSLANSLADQCSIVIDTTTPKVDRVIASATLNPAYVLDGGEKLAAGDEVFIEAHFNLPVSVLGSPRVYVYTGETNPKAQEVRSVRHRGG